MRDAFGGAFSIKLMLVFLVLYVAFICVALNYSRAFRVKNRIIDIIEQNEGYNINNTSDAVANQIDSYLRNTGYYINAEARQYLADKNVSSCSQLYGQGYCVYKISSNPDYYGVETYMIFTLPIINIKFPIAVKGETRMIET